MDAYLSTGLGIFVSIILFLFTYKQTIGAKKERAKNANHSIQRAVMRRMVLEEYAPKYKDLTKIISGKAREFQVSINDLLSEEQILNNLFTEVFDSDLIPPSQRVEIEDKLNGCIESIEQETSKPSLIEIQQMAVEKKQKTESLSLMVFATSILGVLSSLLYSFFETKKINTEWILSEWLYSGIGVLVTSVVALSVISLIRKNKEIVEIPSRRVAQMVSSEFENEIAKILEKMKIKYTIEPNIGRFRPDFLVDVEGKKIAIEAKSWSNVVPLSQIKRTLDHVSALASTEEIDHVFLVTNKKYPLPLRQIENKKVSIISIGDLGQFLKKAS